jgi:hypothetical protein
MENDIPIPEDVFKSINTDQKMRNAVAFAHECHTGGGFDHFCALAYPQRYIVTQEQINEAKAVLAKAKEEVFSKHRNNLLFVSMGCNYEARYEDDPCNHRIRTEFLNKDGHRFFIEICAMGQDGMFVDFSIDRDCEIEYETKRAALRNELNGLQKDDPRRDELKKKMADSQQCNPGYHFGGIEHANLELKYTKQNILKLVNETFGCLFKNIIIDQHTISCDDREIICYSQTAANAGTRIVQQLEMF